MTKNESIKQEWNIATIFNKDFKNGPYWDFSGGPVVKNSPCNAGDMGSIHDKGLRSLLYAVKQLSPCATARMSVHCS